MTNTVLVLLVVAICLGFLLGMSAMTVFHLILWIGFWIVTGTIITLAIDAAAGLGPRICSFRAAMRACFNDGASWYRRRHLRKTVLRHPHLHAVFSTPQR